MTGNPQPDGWTTETALQESAAHSPTSELRFRALVETSSDAIIPRATATESAAPVVSTTLTQPKAKGTILVVEDEESVSEFVRLVLEDAGFHVRLAAHGGEGLEAFEQNHREVVGVVLDLTMPEMDGLELAQRIRHMRTGVPILLMSGYSEWETLTGLAEICAAGFLQKPFRPDELISRVCQMLPK
jgi:CheY-like chemotaxis protein